MSLPGCASLDPSDDLAQASTLVETRADTQTGWSSPWYEPSRDWDGRSALSSETAVRVALQNNRGIRRKVETIVASRGDFVQAHLLPNPVINIAIGIPTDGLGGQPLTIALIQQLSWIWTRPAAIDGAEADLRARILAVSDAALRLVAEVRQAHARVVFDEQVVALQQDNIALVARSTDLVDDRFSVGEASRLDVNRLKLDSSKRDLPEKEIEITVQRIDRPSRRTRR